MWISQVTLNNFRSFENANIQLSKGINLIVGANNSGKSTLLKSILWIQNGFALPIIDLRISKKEGYVHLSLKEVKKEFMNMSYTEKILLKLKLSYIEGITSLDLTQLGDEDDGSSTSHYSNTQNLISDQEPSNYIYPYLSKRKVIGFEQTINSSIANSVRGNLSNLYAKIDRICNPQIPAYKQYFQACEDIIGFPVTTTSSTSGKEATYIVSNWENIPLNAMGEGVANLLGLIVDLCMAENKLFLIEEPENDIHPKALKKLLNLIAEKSVNNQFIITTHSTLLLNI